MMIFAARGRARRMSQKSIEIVSTVVEFKDRLRQLSAMFQPER